MHKEQKILIVISIVIIIVGLFVLYNRQNIISFIDSKLNSVAKSVVGDQYSGWQTYTNKQYGYTIKYPKGFYVDDRNSEKNYYKDLGESVTAHYGGDTIITNYPDVKGLNNVPSDYVGIRYVFWKFEQNITLDEYLSSMTDKLDKLQKFNLNGTPAAIYFEYDYAEDGKHKLMITPTFMAIKDDKIFMANYTYYEGTKDLISVADNIIRSFTFTK
jgi:hypothetical protein